MASSKSCHDDLQIYTKIVRYAAFLLVHLACLARVWPCDPYSTQWVRKGRLLTVQLTTGCHSPRVVFGEQQ